MNTKFISSFSCVFLYKHWQLIKRFILKNFTGCTFVIDHFCIFLDPNSGSSVDWAYSKLRIPYTYLVEMMPSEDSAVMKSFLIPPALMVQNAKDLLEGLRVMAASIMQWHNLD